MGWISIRMHFVSIFDGEFLFGGFEIIWILICSIIKVRLWKTIFWIELNFSIELMKATIFMLWETFIETIKLFGLESSPVLFATIISKLFLSKSKLSIQAYPPLREDMLFFNKNSFYFCVQLFLNWPLLALLNLFLKKKKRSLILPFMQSFQMVFPISTKS